MGRDGHTVVTPEAVTLHLDTAGVGSRTLAALLDVMVIGVTLLIAAFVLGMFGSLGSTGAWVVGSVVVLFATFLYFAVLEAVWDGRTVGKRALGLRVVTTSGGPAPTSAIVTRNIVRMVDLLPGLPLVGPVAILATRSDQRLGDLAAGTLVVRHGSVQAPAPVDIGPPPAWAASLDVSGLTVEDRRLLRAYVTRESTISGAARYRLSRTLADRLRQQVPGLPTRGNDDQLIDAVARRVLHEPAPPDQR